MLGVIMLSSFNKQQTRCWKTISRSVRSLVIIIAGNFAVEQH